MRTRARKAFTLVEILIVVVILGILAAIIIPQFTSASEEAQVGNVQTQLQTVRSQIELFRVRNNGYSPVLDSPNDFEDFLRGENNSLSLPIMNTYQETLGDPDLKQRPYMRSAPINPRNKQTAVIVTTNLDVRGEAAGMDPLTTPAGWVYNVDTGDFAAVGFDETTNQWFQP